MQSTISRFACRILVDRNESKSARIYAAGFDSSRNIFLGVSIFERQWNLCDLWVLIVFVQEKATKWQDNVEIDGLTTNGVLIMHPKGQFCGGNGKCGCWRECSVGGDVFSLRESRSAQQKGQPVRYLTTHTQFEFVLKWWYNWLVFQIYEESNVLQDGTLIDLCGATLLWRSAEGLESSPVRRFFSSRF